MTLKQIMEFLSSYAPMLIPVDYSGFDLDLGEWDATDSSPQFQVLAGAPNTSPAVVTQIDLARSTQPGPAIAGPLTPSLKTQLPQLSIPVGGTIRWASYFVADWTTQAGNFDLMEIRDDVYHTPYADWANQRGTIYVSDIWLAMNPALIPEYAAAPASFDVVYVPRLISGGEFVRPCQGSYASDPGCYAAEHAGAGLDHTYTVAGLVRHPETLVRGDSCVWQYNSKFSYRSHAPEHPGADGVWGDDPLSGGYDVLEVPRSLVVRDQRGRFTMTQVGAQLRDTEVIQNCSAEGEPIPADEIEAGGGGGEGPPPPPVPCAAPSICTIVDPDGAGCPDNPAGQGGTPMGECGAGFLCCAYPTTPAPGASCPVGACMQLEPGTVAGEPACPSDELGQLLLLGPCEPEQSGFGCCD
jgi:hypothetical protein